MATTTPNRVIDPAAVRAQLSRIVSSHLFADSPRMARFLRFVVEEALDGRALHLKENVIGIYVFDRVPNYDPRIDPIVRVEARRLRQKLSAFYKEAGKADAIVFALPKGGYSPEFQIGGEHPPTAIQANAIAVLPFVNLSSDPGSEYLSDGLTEDLISALTRVSNLRVSAWTSAARLKGDQDNLELVRDLLGVTFVLRGSIRTDKDRIRVIAHLIETATNRYTWSGTFNRELTDLFAIQDEITSAIVVALRAKLKVSDQSAGPDRSPQHLLYYQLCLKGRFYSRERTSEGLQRSALCFEQAIEVNPASAPAQAGLADTLALQAEYGLADGPESMRKAKQSVRRALAADPASEEAHASHGLILALYDWSWTAAEQAFQRSLELNASYIPAHHWYSMNHLAMLGRFSEAEAELEAALEIDPLSLVLVEGRGYIRFLRREYDSAIHSYKEMLSGDPSFFKAYTSLGRVYLQLGEYHRAIHMLQKGMSLAGQVPSILGALAQAYGALGESSAARTVIDELHVIARNRPVPSTCFAFAHLGLGDTDTALTWLETAVERRESPVTAFGVHPAYDGLRNETRFHTLVQKVLPSRAVS